MYSLNSISQLMQSLDQGAPLHPLIAVLDYKNVPVHALEKGQRIMLDLYKISFKKNFHGQVRYGQGYYDFEEGGLAFLQPRQIVTVSEDEHSYEGYSLLFHPDLIRNYPLGSRIDQYGFFSYSVSEALFLSRKEKETINDLFMAIIKELENCIDGFTQDVLVTQIELLLNYSNRFYNRQFITRRAVNNDLISRLDKLLDSYFDPGNAVVSGLPSVSEVSVFLNVSARYLSDMLRSLTGLNTQLYIQHKVVEKSKDLLSTTSLSVAEVAYRLGFEHPQSFNKLFRQRTNLSPLQFRKSFAGPLPNHPGRGR